MQSARARETARATAGFRAPHAMSAIPRDASRHPSGDARSPAAPPAGDGTVLVRAGGERVSVAALPRALRPAFAHIQHFNAIQSQMMDLVLNTSSSFFMSAFPPTPPGPASRPRRDRLLTRRPPALTAGAPEGSGKTVVLELALTRALLQTPRMASAAGACWGSVMPGERRRVALYVAPTPALARARAESWSARFGPLGVTCAPLADALLRPVPIDASRADVFVATPETLLAFVKRARSSADTADKAREVMESVKCVLLDDCYARADVEAAIALARAAFAERATSSGARGTPRVSYARVSTRSEAPWPKHTTRFAVVSAPVSNARELGAWLGARPSAVRAFGYEHGPTPVSVEVVGFAFPYATSAFAFERALDEKLADVVRARRTHDSEPALVFCASREGACNAARALAASAEATRAAGKGHPFVRDDRHRKSLAAAAARARDATLRRTLPEGVGVYTTAVCRADREFLEVLFETQSVPVLCCAYAAGVSSGGEKKTFLPAHVAAPLCVIKGTRRYDGGGAYAEMDAGDLARAFAVCGRAGVDRDARVVIMTHRDTYDLYARRAKGSGETVASSYSVTEKIRSALAERLNGLFVCGALTDAADAEAWFDETLAGFGSRRREARDAIDAVTRELRELGALDTSARRRSDANVLRDSGEGHAERLRLVPTALGAAMDDARATLETMRAFRDADPAPATTRELLLFLCGLAEFGDVALRRNEKKLLREWNRARSSAGGTRFVRFPVMQEARARNANAKDVVATAIRAPREKLFVLAQVSMSDAREPNFADAPERARREAERFAIRAPALAGAAFATFAAAGYRPIADGRFSACFAAARLAASLAARRWDDTPTPLSQFVPRAVAARLADTEIVSLDDALTRSPRELERAASLAPPFGKTLLDKVRALPPAVTVSLSRSALDARGASRIIVRVDESAFFSVDVSKPPDDDSARVSSRAPRHASEGDPDPPKWTARVLVGCLWKDTLLFEARVERLSVAAGARGGAVFERAVDLPPGAAPPPGEESSVVAALVHERCLGRDAHAELALTPRSPASPERPAARRARLETPPSAAPRREENDVDAVARVDLMLDSDEDDSIASLDFDAPPRKTPRVAAP